MNVTESFEGEDKEPIPKLFVLTALPGCTGMNVVAILGKTEQKIESHR